MFVRVKKNDSLMFANNVLSILTFPRFKIYTILSFRKIFFFHSLSWIKMESTKVVISWLLTALYGYTLPACAQTYTKEIIYSFLAKTNALAIPCIPKYYFTVLFLINQCVICTTYKHKLKYFNAINGLRCMAYLVCVTFLFDSAYSKIHVLTAYSDVLRGNTTFGY